MIEDYKAYNNLPQQDKESAMAKAAENSNTNEDTLIAQTDQVESLLSTIHSDLGTIHTDLTNLKTALEYILSTAGNIYSRQATIDSDIKAQGQAIVAAINGQQ